MFSLKAKIRKISGKKVAELRKQDKIPAVLYGHEIKPVNLELDAKEFETVFKEAGESSLITLDIKGAEKELPAPEILVLVHEFQRHPLRDNIIHVDFYHPNLKKEVEARVPLVFEGESAAVGDLGGTLVKQMSEVEVKALPHKLPKEIIVDISKLKTFENEILIKDLVVPDDVSIARDKNEGVAAVVPPTKVEEELEKPIEDKVEDVERIEKEKREEGSEEAAAEPKEEAVKEPEGKE